MAPAVSDGSPQPEQVADQDQAIGQRVRLTVAVDIEPRLDVVQEHRISAGVVRVAVGPDGAVGQRGAVNPDR